MDNNELYHHGVIGQKWGVRRYQNYDGSLTSLGKRRLGRSSDSSGKKKTQSAKSAEKQMKQDVKNRSSMTNQELREKIEHLRLQRELRTLTDEELRPGRAAMNDILKTVGKNVATTALTGAALYSIKSMVSGMGYPEFAEALASGKPQKLVQNVKEQVNSASSSSNQTKSSSGSSNQTKSSSGSSNQAKSSSNSSNQRKSSSSSSSQTKSSSGQTKTAGRQQYSSPIGPSKSSSGRQQYSSPIGPSRASSSSRTIGRQQYRKAIGPSPASDPWKYRKQ